MKGHVARSPGDQPLAPRQPGRQQRHQDGGGCPTRDQRPDLATHRHPDPGRRTRGRSRPPPGRHRTASRLTPCSVAPLARIAAAAAAPTPTHWRGGRGCCPGKAPRGPPGSPPSPTPDSGRHQAHAPAGQAAVQRRQAQAAEDPRERAEAERSRFWSIRSDDGQQRQQQGKADHLGAGRHAQRVASGARRTRRRSLPRRRQPPSRSRTGRPAPCSTSRELGPLRATSRPAR